MDLSLVSSTNGNDEPCFIEAGSALFQWIYDHDILHDSSVI
jgi:hypothetical protein